MSLYRKYRPNDFDEIVGNEAEIESIKLNLEKENKSQVYLLTGPPGCGKTTIARIMAKKLGASELSIHEINSAENRGIDTARGIIEQLKYVSMEPRVYIVDELHKTTNDWQNAMLKPLEDTPQDTYFFLCTTDPTKLIAAIKTRCTQIKVSSLEPELIYRHLYRIAKKEGLEISKKVLLKIAEVSDGSMRKALVFLEKIMGMTDEEKMLEVLELGEEAELQVIEFCRILLKAKSWNQIVQVLQKVDLSDSEKVRYAVMGYMGAVLMKTENQKAAQVLECFSESTFYTGKNGIILFAYQSFLSE